MKLLKSVAGEDPFISPGWKKKMNIYVRNISGEKQILMLEINRHKVMYYAHIGPTDRHNLEKIIMKGMMEGHHSSRELVKRWMYGVWQITGRSAAECSKLAMDHEVF
ncbi:hypothetical protein KIL84_019870 [Mauremys mutica]|uniref:Uncharacterized protein n=1 Tax=Mauremys mutica TaxID=74926 RepID=A0A9D3XVN8_9SAUR|nr:hypothetical protein KIL84_019870 [Mauremys mutica]